MLWNKLLQKNFGTSCSFHSLKSYQSKYWKLQVCFDGEKKECNDNWGVHFFVVGTGVQWVQSKVVLMDRLLALLQQL